MINDLSLNTLVISAVIGGSIWLFKIAMTEIIKLLIAAIKNLISKLNETIGRVEILDKKMDTLATAVGDHEKLRRDIQYYFTELKNLRSKLENLEQK